jgi:hypothetical protein
MFNARFLAGDRHEGPYTVLIDYKTAAPSPIVGYVVGNNQTASRLLFPGHFAALQSVTDKYQPDRIECPHADFRALYRSGFREDEAGLTAMAGYFVARLVDIHRIGPSRNSEPLTITFTLAGPTHAWRVWRSDPFDPESKYENAEVAGISDSLSVWLEPQAVGWTAEDGYVSQQVTTLKLSRSASPSADVDEQRWLAETTETVDDLLVLMSLLSDAWVGWYERHFQKAEELSTRRRAIRWTPREDATNRHLPVDDPRQFLIVALPTLRSWRQRGFDLSRPLEYLINASEHAEGSQIQKFASAYLALENLLGIFLEKERRVLSLDQQTFANELEPKIKACIKSVVLDRETRRLLYEKLRDINRPAFSTTLDDCLKANDVLWHDLYPDNHTLKRPDFIAIRNELFHTGSRTSKARLVLETLRVRSVAYRLLLRYLGWKKDVEWPPDHRHSYLRGLWGDEESFAQGF